MNAMNPFKTILANAITKIAQKACRNGESGERAWPKLAELPFLESWAMVGPLYADQILTELGAEVLANMGAQPPEAQPNAEETTDKSIAKIMDGLPSAVCFDYVRQEPTQHSMDATPDKVVVVLSFSEKGFGFGQVTFVQTKEGLAIDTECMSLDRVKKYLTWLVDNAVKGKD